MTVENPDEELVGKLLAIAQALKTRVQGGDGEYFDETQTPAHTPALRANPIFAGSTDF